MSKCDMNHLRRDVVECSDIHRSIDEAMERLSSIWNHIGILGDQRISRCGVVAMHINTLLEDMIKEEHTLYNRLLDSASRLKADLCVLYKELGLPVYQPPEELTLLQLEKDLKVRFDALNAEKQDRLNRLRLRSVVDQELCDVLCVTPYYVPSTLIPSEKQLMELEKHIESLESEKSKRLKTSLALRENSVKLFHEMELSPNSTFEREVVQENEALSITSDSMRALRKYHDELVRLRDENASLIARLWVELRALWDRVEIADNVQKSFQAQSFSNSQRTVNLIKDEICRCEALKQHTLDRQVQLARSELVSLWDKCFIGAAQRQAFQPFNEVSITEDVLIDLKTEIQNVRCHYELNKELFEKVAKREEMWKEFLTLEHRASNPDRFLNRGGNLLKEEKARKKLTLDIPKVEQDILMDIKQFEIENGRQLKIDGLPFDEYTNRQRSEYTAGKENEKMLRHQQKARLMEEEIMFGSKPLTPGPKRCAGNTPTNTPNKLKKVTPESPKTPSSGRKTKPNVPSSPSKSLAFKELMLHEGAKVPDAGKSSASRQKTASLASTASHSPDGAASNTKSAHCDINLSHISLVSIGPYEDFAKGINAATTSNKNSTMHPHIAFL